MDFTGLGTTLSTTGWYLTPAITFLWICTEIPTKCCHLCHRYLRFFPDGSVVMLTTPEDPLSVVPRLRTRNTRYTVYVVFILSWKGRCNITTFNVTFNLNIKSRHFSQLWILSYLAEWILSCSVISVCHRRQTIKPKFLLLSARKRRRWVRFKNFWVEKRISRKKYKSLKCYILIFVLFNCVKWLFNNRRQVTDTVFNVP